MIPLGQEASIFGLASVAAARHGSNCLLESPACLEGEYGISGLFVGVPVKLGANGIETIFELKLAGDEHAALEKSAAAVNKLADILAPKLGLTQAAGAV
ncbi:MAG: hypothetical protein ABSC08_12685 [Bryobacteraceae bacterium]